MVGANVNSLGCRRGLFSWDFASTFKKSFGPHFPSKSTSFFLFLLFLHERNFIKKKKKNQRHLSQAFNNSHFPKKMINPQKCKGVRDEETEKPPLRKASFFHGLSQKSSLTLWKLSEKGCCNLTLPQKEITVKSNNSTYNHHPNINTTN